MPKQNKLKSKSKTNGYDDFAFTVEDAGQGNLYSQLQLAQMYQEGTKIPKNDVEAFRWFFAAAQQEDVSAMYEVGNSYARGIGVTQDKSEAIKWLYKLAYPESPSLGITSKMLHAQMLISGIYYWPGETHDLSKSYGWLLLAICYAQPWDVEETAFNCDILRVQKELANMLEETKAKLESEMTDDERTRGQQMAAELFRPLNRDDDGEE